MDFEGIHVVVTGGRTRLIPEWVSDRSKECEVSIEFPKKWYKETSWELLYSSILFIFLLLMMIRQDMTLLTTMV